VVIDFEKFINNLISVLLLIISCLHGRASQNALPVASLQESLVGPHAFSKY